MWYSFRPSGAIFVFLSLFLQQAWAQQPNAGYRFERISPSKGISQSIVYGIIQDSSGLIWAGTEEGIVRYNSKNIKLYNRNHGFPAQVKNRTTAICLDAAQRIWAGTENALLYFDSNKDAFEQVRMVGDIKPVNIKAIVQGNQQDIWVAALNGIWKITPDANGFQATHVVKDMNVEALAFDQQKLLFGTAQGLFLLDPNATQPQPAPCNAAGALQNVTAIFQKGDHYLIGTRSKGLFQLDQNWSQLRALPIPNLASAHIKKVIDGGNNGLFVATDGNGLYRIDQGYSSANNYLNDADRANSISSNGVYDVLLGQENILWLATYGGGINYVGLTNGFVQNLTHRTNDPNTLYNNFTRAILEDTDGNLWLGTKEGLSIWYRKQGRWRHLRNLGPPGSPDIVMALQEAGNYVWTGTYGNGAFKIDKKTLSATQYHPDAAVVTRRIQPSRIYSMLVDAQGNCWLGGIDKDLTQIAYDGNISTYPISQIRHIV